MFSPSEVAEPSPMIRLERLRARLRAEHLAELDATPEDEGGDPDPMVRLDQARARCRREDPIEPDRRPAGDRRTALDRAVSPSDRAGSSEGDAAEPGSGPPDAETDAGEAAASSAGLSGGEAEGCGRRDLVAEAFAAIDAAIHEDLGSRPDAELDARMVAVTALADRAGVLRAVTAGAWAPRATWSGRGPWSSAAGWLDRETGMARAEAHRVIKTGAVIAEHPVVADAVRSGSLTCRKAEVLGPLNTEARAGLFARDAQVLVDTITGLQRLDDVTRLARRWKTLADDETASAEAGARYDQREFHHSEVGGRWKTNGTFDPVDGATIDAALRDALDPPDPADRPGGARTYGQRMADAMVRLAKGWLANRNESRGNAVASVTVHLTPDALTGSSVAGFDPHTICELTPGGPISRSTAQRLLCDGLIGRVILGADGEILDFGRQKRLFTPAQRRAMVARDGPFCVMGSGVPAAGCEAHHLWFWEHDGPTDTDNGALVGPAIHHLVHDRGFTLERAGPRRYRLTAPDGRTWTSHITTTGITVTTNS